MNARPVSKDGAAVAKQSESVVMLADTGTGTLTPVPVPNQTTDSAIEAATAKPAQTADDLVLKVRRTKNKSPRTRRRAGKPICRICKHEPEMELGR